MSKLEYWQGFTLSMAGTLSLITSIIHSSLHSFQIYQWTFFVFEWAKCSYQELLLDRLDASSEDHSSGLRFLL